MSPERIAELRDWATRLRDNYPYMGGTAGRIDEMLDEIERLRGLVEGMHAQMPDEPDRCQCGWVAPCSICAATGWDGDELCKCVEAEAWANREHAAHVRQILDGGGA